MRTRRRNKNLSLVLILALGISLNFSWVSPSAAALADHLVVNEIAVDSLSGSGGSEDDFIELFNPTLSAVPLSGWSIQKTTGTGTSLVRRALSGSVAAQGYFLLVRDGASTSPALKASADLLLPTFSIADGNVVYLVSNNEDITGASDPDIVDLAGFGSALIFEGAAAVSIDEEESIARTPAGEDKDNNALDFVLGAPTPQGSGVSGGGDDDLSGSVLLTIAPASVLAQNISASGAEIVFQANGSGTARIDFGPSSAYGSSSASQSFSANTDSVIALSGLACGAVYHYSVYAENAAGTENDRSADQSFETLPCGLRLDSLAMTRSGAKANNNYADGWAWEFALTVWDANETTLKMQFAEWTGPATLSAGGNMLFSVNGTDWSSITDNGQYPDAGANLAGVDESPDPGRQILVRVRMKVPAGTLAGVYSSNYGILTE